jgi:hypothetical protein
MNPDDLIGLTWNRAQTIWHERSSMELRLVESAPPQRPVSSRPNPNRSSRKKNFVQEAKPVRVQHWGEARVLRCREADDNGTKFLEVTIAREEAVSESVARAL